MQWMLPPAGRLFGPLRVEVLHRDDGPVRDPAAVPSGSELAQLRLSELRRGDVKHAAPNGRAHAVAAEKNVRGGGRAIFEGKGDGELRLIRVASEGSQALGEVHAQVGCRLEALGEERPAEVRAVEGASGACVG